MIKITKKFNKSSILYVATSAKMRPIFQTISFKTNKAKFDFCFWLIKIKAFYFYFILFYKKLNI